MKVNILWNFSIVSFIFVFWFFSLINDNKFVLAELILGF